jgi:uncharacterized membrane protein
MMMGWLLFVPLMLIGVIAFILGWRPEQRTGGSGQSDRQDPVDIIRTRYARGDINRDQYEEMIRDLNG